MVYALLMEQHMSASVAMNTNTQKGMDTVEWHTGTVMDTGTELRAVHAIIMNKFK